MSGHGLVHTQGRNQTNTEAGKEAAGEEHGQGDGGGLENDTEDKYKRRSDESEAAADLVSHQGRSQSTEEGTGRENRDDSRRLRGRDNGLAGAVDVAGREELLPVVHGEDTTDGAGVVAGGLVEERKIRQRLKKDFAHPKRTPPKATKMPMRMAGQALPASSVGRLISCIVRGVNSIKEVISGFNVNGTKWFV